MSDLNKYDFDLLLSQATDTSSEQSEAAEEMLMEILESAHKTKLISKNMDSIADYAQLTAFCEKFMQVFFTLLLNPKHEFSRLSSYLFGICKPYIEMMMVIIKLQDPSAIHKAIQGLADQINMGQLLGRHLMALTPTTSVTFGDDLGYSLFMESAPVITVPAFIGAISQRSFLSDTSEAFKRMVYDHIRYNYDYVAHGIDFSPQILNVPGMYITYDHKPEIRHDMRRYLNSLLKGYLDEKNIEAKPVVYIRKAKPRISIFAESFRKEHVMFRTFSLHVIEMLKDFEVTIITNENVLSSEKMKNALDGASFTSISGLVGQALVDAVQATEPDVLLYLSVGMSYESKLLSQLRLAPVQVMFTGHPDSTQSQYMDFVVYDAHFVRPGQARVEALWPERFIGVKGKHNTSVAYMKNFQEECLTPDIRPTLGDTVHIAIIGYGAKLNMPYLHFLKRVQEASPIKVIYHFFPNVMGIEYLYTVTQLKEMFDDAMTFPPQKIEAYMCCIGECDIAIGTFPFGGSNSIADCFVSGVPMASLVGIEPLEVAEYFAHCVVGSQDHLCAHSQDELLSLILRLIEDDAFRIKMSNFVLENSDAQFEVNDDMHYFSRAIKWAHDHFEEIQESPQRTYILGQEELE